MGKYFGTDGFRGEVNVRLTAEHAYKIGQFLGDYFGCGKKARVVIGRDTRKSGDMLEAAIASGLMTSGADVYLLHITTTPSVSYLVKEGGFDCGVMISASHNPYYDNGIKLLNSGGEKIEPEIEKKIEEYIDGVPNGIKRAARSDIGCIVDYDDARKKYISHLKAASTHNLKGMKIAFDCGNGSASDLAPDLFNELGIETHIINNSPDGININENCGSTHLEALKKYVVENSLEAGFAFDGDADRCLAVDENGRELDGDKIMFICAKHLKEKGRLNGGALVATVMSNIGLIKSLKNEGIDCFTTDVGDKYVSEKMRSGGYRIGGEQSGHIIFGEYANTGDGMLTALMVLNTMADKKKSLSDLADEVKIYPQRLKNVRVKDKEAVLSNKNVLYAVKLAENELGSDGRILVRKSGTEPLIRVMAEAASDELCERCVNDVIEVIKSEKLEA